MALAGALVAFAILTLTSGTGGWSALIAAGVIGIAATVLYFHYRRRARIETLTPVVPFPDDGEITADIKAFVAARDGGVCQIKAPMCIVNRKIQYDHIVPRSWGGRTTTDNIQVACQPCNRFKSNNWAGTYANQITRAQLGITA